MEYKRMEGTLQRPQGDRVLDAPYVFTDLDKYTQVLTSEEAWKKSDRNGITVFKSDTVSIVLVCLHEKATVTNEAVNGFITLHLISGKARISTVDGDIEFKQNQIITFHPFIDHYVHAEEDCVLLLTNSTF
jgi:quercetin dioxygenase-like cupin family protein